MLFVEIDLYMTECVRIAVQIENSDVTSIEIPRVVVLATN